MKFSTKAKNLLILKSLKLKKSKIPKFYKFTVDEIIKNESKIIKIVNKELSKKISIRSSFLLEDNEKKSMAGEFEGLSDVLNSKKNIILGIKKLTKQYKSKTNSINTIKKSEILFQNHVTDSILSGVVTNQCIKDGTDYYVINYDDSSNLTNTVTSGNKSGGRVINVYKYKLEGLRSEKFKKVISSVQEIERKLNKKVKLDIEFGLNKNGIVNIFQIRSISTVKNWKFTNKKSFFNNLKNNQKKFDKINLKNKKFGNKPIFGLMPDWNPAEMIGYQPNNLAYSMYEELITNDSWNMARHKMGYKLVSKPLMYNFTGKPFIDARLSFYSFIPKQVNNYTSKKLVNSWTNILIKKPYLHDKIEFDISDGSYDALTSDKVKKSYNFLNKEEKFNYLNVLREFTNHKIFNYKRTFYILNRDLLELEKQRILLIKKFKSSKIKNPKKEIINMVKQIKTYGIIPFSIYARNAFIAKKFLISLKIKKILSSKSYIKILSSVDSIASIYIKLKKKSSNNNKDFNNFIDHFYHLRPGTFDICVERYKKKFDLYEIKNLGNILSLSQKNYNLSDSEFYKIKKFINLNKFTFNPNELINFCISSIRLRENSKFIFTRSLSDTLEIIQKFGNSLKIENKDLSKFYLREILKLNRKNRYKILNSVKQRHAYNTNINEKAKLPFLITNKNDFFIASLLLTKPNFITKKISKSKILEIKNSKKKEKINNKIILIENADPGYDWVFSHKIKGIITKFGGVNSHMSIRCEELNIPAVIGLGEENYEKIKNCNKVILNCKNEQLIGL